MLQRVGTQNGKNPSGNLNENDTWEEKTQGGEEGYSVYLLEQANQHRQAVALISQLWQWTFLQH